MKKTELKATAERILSTLPRAHYLKASTIEVALSDTAPTSYFDPEHFAITVSLANVWQAIKGNAEALTEEALEATVRALLYHEISHAMLTPKNLFRYGNSLGLSNDLVNIIEDERIETLLASYYHGVDFKANARAIIEYDAPKTFEEWVFYGLRIRKAPFGLSEMIKAFDIFAKATKNIKANGMRMGLDLAKAMFALVTALKAIFDKYVPQTNASANQPKQSERNGDGQPAQSNQGEGNGNQAETAEAEQKAQSAQNGEDGQQPKDGETDQQPKQAEANEEEANENPLEAEPEVGNASDNTIDAKDAEQIMANACLSAKKDAERYGAYSMRLSDFIANKEAKVGMLKAIIRNQGVGVATAPTIGGYNGKFNVHRYVKDQHLTLKWFDKTLDGGERESRKASKKTLNIWLDQSGSFRDHDETINGILKALSEIESSRDDFEWRLIRMNEHFAIERDREKRISQSCGGNALEKDEIAKCYAETNGTSKELNIVLFDGGTGMSEAHIRKYYASNEKYLNEYLKSYSYGNLKVFDNRRTIFITEEENTEGIKQVCPNAREVIEENADYEGRLMANIIRAFDLLF